MNVKKQMINKYQRNKGQIKKLQLIKIFVIR